MHSICTELRQLLICTPWLCAREMHSKQTPPRDLLLIRRHTIINQKNRKRPCESEIFLEKISRAASERLERGSRVEVSARMRVSVCVLYAKSELSAASGVVVGSWVIPGVTLLASTRRRFSMWAKILIFIPMHVRAVPFRQHHLVQSNRRFFYFI
jgi:hypothetical protein